ncbi:MAG: transcription elongation factor GreA [bacterium]
MTEKIIKLIDEHKFTELENLWLEALESNDIPLKELLAIADRLKEIKEVNRGLMLLEILASHLENQKRIEEAIMVYKYMPYFTDNDQLIRNALKNLYKKIYPDNDRIEKYISLCGIEKGENIFKSIERLEEFLKFDIGRVFYFERFGIGEVIAMNPDKRELVLSFEKQKDYHVKFDVAHGLLLPLSEGHFLYKKYKNIEELRKLLREQPITLIKYLLKSFDKPLTSSEIKMHLKGIIENTELDKFWEKARKQLEKDKELKVENIKGQKVYQLIEGIDKKEYYFDQFRKADIDKKYALAEQCLRTSPEIAQTMLTELINAGNETFKTNPALALDIYYLSQDNKKDGLVYTPEDILKNNSYEEILQNLKSVDHKLRLLKMVKKRESDNWQKIYEKIFFTIDDARLMDEIEKQLLVSGFDLKQIYHTIFIMPKKFPAQFQWLLKKVSQGNLLEFVTPAYLPRLIESIDSIKGLKQYFLKAITMERFDDLIERANYQEVLAIRDMLSKCTFLNAYEKNNFINIIDFHFPDLKENKEDVIYTTYEALLKRKEELEHLLKVEIPKNQEEISRAREYGDLSENFEYKAAKERQDQLYQKVRTIEAELQKAKIIDFNNLDTSKVSVGTKVTLKGIQDNRIFDYTILGRWESDLKKNIISNESPMAKNFLLNKKIGDKIEIEGKTYEIINIEPAKQ